MTVYAATAFFQSCYTEDTVASTLTAYHSGAGFEGMYEYAPPGSDITLIATGLPAACLVADPSIVLGKPNPDDPISNSGMERSSPVAWQRFRVRSVFSP